MLMLLGVTLYSRLVTTKVGHQQPFYLCLSRLGCSHGGLQDVWPDKFFQAKHMKTQILQRIWNYS